MPNWSYNHMVVNGTTKQLIKLSKQLESDYGVIDFCKIIPQPDNLFTGNLGSKERERCKELGVPNWYDWQVSNWGTKWNACEASREMQDGTYLTYAFNTAWSPPIPIFEALVEQFPELSFKIECELEGEDKGVSFETWDGELQMSYHPLKWFNENDEELVWDSKNHYWVGPDGQESEEWYCQVVWDEVIDY